MNAMDFLMGIKDSFLSISWNDVLQEMFCKKTYVDVLRKYIPFSAVAIFWIGCNMGSFLNVCIWRLPRHMSLWHPGSHCPNCGHKLSFFENIPIFSYLFLCGSCRSCGDRISPRYLLMELLVGVLYCGVYLKVVYFHLPLLDLLLLFYILSITVVAAFTDCDLRVIPDVMTLPAYLVIPAFWLLHKMPSLNILDWNGFWNCLISMIGTVAALSAFALLGKLIFKREAFGWGDVKYLGAVAAGIGWFPTLLVLTMASVTACIYMPVYWLFRPKRKHRGFAFAPFLAIYTIGWLLGGEFVREFLVLSFRND